MAVEVIKQAAFIRGQILHQGTGAPINGEVRLRADIGPVVDKVLPDGTFVISGCIDQLFPKLNSQDYPLTLTIHAESKEFRQNFLEYSQSVMIPRGSVFDPEPPIAPIPLIDLRVIRLPANPATDPTADSLAFTKNLKICIRGRVVQARDPAMPISNATVEIKEAGSVTHTTTSNLNGRYQFDNIVVVFSSQYSMF